MGKTNTYTDQEIVEGLLVNNRVIIAYLYQEMYPMVAGQLTKQGASKEDIRDMFQEGIIALWRNVHQGSYQLQVGTKLSTYLVQICKKRWLEKRRKAQNRYEIVTGVASEHGSEASFLDQWMKQEEMEAFGRHFRQLGERCRKILRRFYFERKSMKQIADEFKLTEATAKNEKYRCMQRLKQIYQSN